jgi:quinolinate synthase
MYRVHPAYLAWTVESLAEARIVNQIVVPDGIKRNAKLALDRMLAIK